MNPFHSDNSKYADIIDLPRPQSKRPKMSMQDRAAQFSPFAALTGHEEAIWETARTTDPKLELSPEELDRLNQQLLQMQETIDDRKMYRFTYFVPDDRKWGGEYVQHEGILKRLDSIRQCLMLTDGTEIDLNALYSIEEVPNDED